MPIKTFNSRFLDFYEEIDMPRRKPVVNYRDSPHQRIELGHPAIVHPTNHPDRLHVSNTKEVITSRVVDISYDKEMKVVEFETMNTLYRRAS